jgi:UDP-N-acetylmuramoylalanine--D-glutamate ligase
MIVSPAFRGKRYAVFGLARSGLATVRALLASGAHVVAWDDREEARAEAAGAEIVDLNTADLKALALNALIVSPGVPLNTHPLAAAAREAGVAVIGDIELFARARPLLPPHRVVGITGTNGKSTTTALIHHILKRSGTAARLGGNIGLPILAQEPLPKGGVYVLELSSFQIDLTQTLACDVAVLTNITPDHLDRYDGFDAYVASKARLFRMQAVSGRAVIATDDDQTRAIARRVKAQLTQVSAERKARFGVQVVEGAVYFDGRMVASQRDWPTLQGPHNAQNAAAAIGACRALGLPDNAIVAALRTYPGLPHRMERVKEKGGVLYVNDSKATNPTSTAPALGSYPAIHWILGGLAKTEDLDACAPWLDHVKAAYTIGKAGPMFARLLKDKVPSVIEAGDIDHAVQAASAAAKPGEVVLLSPACASYDQFSDFEARGRAFAEAVERVTQ